MKYNPDIHHRMSVRLKEYDYSQPGAYFITVCTQKGECVFGDVVGGEIVLNQLGEIVKTEWLKTFDLRRNLILDEYIVMPNHFHGIIIVINNDSRGTLQRAPTFEQFCRPVSNSILINDIHQTPGIPLWQRNYYEHIIRNEDGLNKIREYIQNNPQILGKTLKDYGSRRFSER